jgi:acyl-CoA synthetase (AMP-forming)/AMP-acid ligase II
VVRGAFATGDRRFVTGDLFRVDTEGDYWFVDHRGQLIRTRFGAVASTRIEDALYEVPGVALCAAAGRPDPDDPEHQAAFAAVELRPGARLDLDALSAAVAQLPEYARPRRVRVLDTLPVTDGFRPIKRALGALDLADGPASFAWDARAQRYQPTASSAARTA